VKTAPRVVWSDRDWIAVDKPSGLATTAPEAARTESLVAWVRTSRPSLRHVHPLSRLDVDVTGLVLIACSDTALRAAERARETNSYARRYMALLARAPQPPAGEWRWPIGVDPRNPKRRLADAGQNPQPALTQYRTAAVSAAAWVTMDLHTGRTHQIRVHTSHAGSPVLGDRTYGGPTRIVRDDGSVVAVRRALLHAFCARVPGRAKVVRVDPPADFADAWAALGGDRWHELLDGEALPSR